MDDPQSLALDLPIEATVRQRPPISVAFVSPGWPPNAFSNGVIPYIDKIAGELGRQGHRASILASNVVGEVDGVTVRDIRPDYVSSNPFIRKVDKLAFKVSTVLGLRRQSVRSVVQHCRWLVENRGLQLLEMEEAFGLPYWVRRKLTIPVVVRLHGPQFLNGSYVPKNYPGLQANIRAERLAIAEADSVTSPSFDILERTRAYYGLDLKDALVIPPPTDMVSEVDRWSCHGCDPNLVLFVGRFDLHKGGDLMIKAFAEVAQRRPDARLKFVGPDRGLTGEDGQRVGIEDYIRREAPAASGRIEYLGQLPNADLSKLRRKARVTVACSRYETFGLTLAESITHGCPTVATRSGAFPEILQDGVNGLVCEPEDPRGMADKICALLEDEALAVRLGRRAALDGAARYEASSLARELSEHYRKLIETRGHVGQGVTSR